MVTLDSKQLDIIQDKLHKYCGIHLDDSKITMIKNRIYVLMKETHIYDINELLKTLDNNEKNRQIFINSFTTNKTNFFREEFHFQDMIDRALPILFKQNKPIKIYCCASSTGQEPYSIAIAALYARKIYNSTTPISIIATDIDTEVLQDAKNGLYYVDSNADKFPSWCDISEYFDILDERVDSKIKTIKAKQQLKNIITFKQMNLFSNRYPFSSEEFDILFCRNVLIYFTPTDQQSILYKLINTLKVEGTFYLGHSESMYQFIDYFEKLGNKTFVKNANIKLCNKKV